MSLKVFRDKIIFFFFWLASLAVNWPLLSTLLYNTDQILEKNLWSNFSYHLLSCTLIFLTSPKNPKFIWYSREHFWAYTYFLICFFLPIFGHAICLVLFLFYKKPDYDHLVEAHEGDSYIVRPELDYEEKLDFVSQSNMLKQKIDEGVDLVPLSDIMSGQDTELKRGAVEKLIQHGTPEAIDLLLKYRNDSSPDVRFFVTAGINRYKKELDEHLEAAKVEMKKNVENTNSRILLAKVYIKYVKSRLLDEISMSSYMNEAKYNLVYAIDAGTNDPDAYKILLEIYETTGEWEKANDLINQMKEKGYIDDMEFTKSSINILYHTRQFHELITHIKKLITFEEIESEWVSMANWWGVTK